jgi:diaminopimelate epimerase
VSTVAEGLAVVVMHGTHNQFVLLDERPPRALDYVALARRWCAPAFGLDADGLLVIAPPPMGDAAQATMRIFNADGSEAEMCGNGVRCVARYLAERGAGERFTLATLAGPIAVEILAREPDYLVRLDVGAPLLEEGGRPRELHADGRTWEYQLISLGNPHAVVTVDDVAAVDVARSGAAIATHPDFPAGANAHFVRRIDDHTLEVRHYERGVGITQACGTGAVACAVAFIARGDLASPVTVRVPGGHLEVTWTPGASATLSGPAETLFERVLAP